MVLGAAKIKYKLIPKEATNEEEIEWITEGRGTVILDDIKDGEYILKAYTIDKAGRESRTNAEKTVKIDSVAPIVTSITVSKTTSYTITAQANGTDNASGIKNYTFQHRLYGTTDWVLDGTVEIEERTNRRRIYIYKIANRKTI